MNDPPDQTAELSAANLLSLGGMMVPNHLRTMSGYSRTAVSMSVNRTPMDSRSARLRWDTTSLSYWAVTPAHDLPLVLGRDPGQVLALRLGDPELLVGVLDGVGEVVPVLDLVLGRLDVVVDVVEVEVGHVDREPSRHRL